MAQRGARSPSLFSPNQNSSLKKPKQQTISVRIREATLADLPSVLALYAQPDIDCGNMLPAAQAEQIFARFKQYPDYRLYVAESGNRVVGTFALLIMDNLAHQGARSGLVEDVVVDAASQRRGIGRRMMAFALDRCRAAGCYKMTLSSNLKRRAAHRFYEDLEFARHGYSFSANVPMPNHPPVLTP
jgi:GNAT superfamily N-acetyltransferase